MQTPPDTSAYMIAAYAIFFSVMLLYLLSLFLRWKKQKQELEKLKKTEQEK